MSVENASVEHPGAQAAGQALATATQQRNPIIAVAAALLGPIIGLFRARRVDRPIAVNKMKLESYSETRGQSPELGRAYLERRMSEGRAKEAPIRRSHMQDPRGRRRPRRSSAAVQEGGGHHG